MVPPAKFGAWFLLMIISFVLVSLVNAPRDRRMDERTTRIRQNSIACWIFGIRDREEGDRAWRDLDRTRRRCHRGKLRNLVIGTELQSRFIQLHVDALQVIRRQRVRSLETGNRKVAAAVLSVLMASSVTALRAPRRQCA